jgi:hypothetical protein
MAKPRSPKQRAREAKRTPTAHAGPAPAAAPAPAAHAAPAPIAPEPPSPVVPAPSPAAAADPVVTPPEPAVTAVETPVPSHAGSNSAAHGSDHHTPSDDHDADHVPTGHGHHEDELGPFDVVMWTFGMVGVMLGILVWAAFAISTTSI